MPGRENQHSPVPQLFEETNFVVCSFLVGKLKFQALAILGPYPHPDIVSAEVKHYATGILGNRTDTEVGSLTLQSDGVLNGQQPPSLEASTGKEGRSNSR